MASTPVTARPDVIMEVDRVSVRFGGLTALSAVSFDVRDGEITALIGPNGAGKTTLLNVVAGALAPSGGQVRYLGKRLNGRTPPERVRLGIARTFQQADVFGHMSVLENVMVGCHLRAQAGLLEAALRLPRFRREEEDVALDALRHLNYVGLGPRAAAPAASLPFGQQRLLAMARALACEPRLILLDEPAAGLNRLEKNDLADLIGRIRESGITVILVEHDMELVMRLADWVVVLNQGARLAEGRPDDVRRNPAVVEAYLGVEAPHD